MAKANVAAEAATDDLELEADFDSAFDDLTGKPEDTAGDTGGDAAGDAAAKAKPAKSAKAAPSEAEEGESKGEGEGEEGGEDEGVGEGEGKDDEGEGEGEGEEKEEGEAESEEGAEGDEETATEVARRLSQVEEELRKRGAPPEDTKKEEPVYTPEETAVLNKYKEDWPDVMQAEALIRRAEYRDITNYIFSEVARIVVPYLQYIDETSTEGHTEAIHNAHGDYDEIYDDVLKWIDKQPSYLKSALEHVRDNGTAQEIIDVIDRYKKENNIPIVRSGASRGGNGGALPPSTGTPKPKLSEKAQAAARKLQSGPASRSAPVNAGNDPGDFDSAFDEFAGQ